MIPPSRFALLSDEERVEAVARLLCLACGENPDSRQPVMNNADSPWLEVWKTKYRKTAQRLIRMGMFGIIDRRD